MSADVVTYIYVYFNVNLRKNYTDIYTYAYAVL